MAETPKQPIFNSQKLYDMSEKELHDKFNNIMYDIGDNFYKIKPLNIRITKTLRENFYKKENDKVQLNTNFEDIEEFEYEIDVFCDYFQLVKEKIAKARLMKAILLEKQSRNQSD